MTAPGNYGKPWFSSTNNDHAKKFLRLDADGEDITNNEYLANSGAWNGVRAAGTPGDFKLIGEIPFQNTSNESGHGIDEGFITIASDDSVIYGNVLGYKDNSSSECYEQGRNSGYWSQNPGATGIYWNRCDGSYQGPPAFDNITIDRLYYHDIGLVGDLNSSLTEIQSSNEGNHSACKLDRGLTYDYENGIRWRFNISDDTRYGTNGNGDKEEQAETGYGRYYEYWNNKTFADGACTDWFAETKWGQEYGRDVILMHVARNEKRAMFSPDDGWGNSFVTNREGILVMKRDENSNNLVLLDQDQLNSGDFTDINGYEKLAYKFDNTWGTIYNSPCCEDSSGVCFDLPSNEGLLMTDCSNGPTFIWPNPSGPYVGGYYDWANWSESSVQESYGLADNGDVPTLRGSLQPWLSQPFYSAISGGLSFRPNWKI